MTVTTKDDVPTWCTDSLRTVLSKAGLPIGADKETVTVSGELQSFFVTEKDTYVGDVTIKIKVTNRAGTVLWTGMANGASKRWGRSYSADNYNEVLSDSVMEAAYSLLKNQRFMDALAGKAGAK